MFLITMGMDFQHSKGEFCQRNQFQHYTICCFYTPFTYLKDGKLCTGNKWEILINTPGSTVYHGPRPDMESGFVNDWIHLYGEDFGRLLERYPLPLNEAFSIGREHTFRSYANKLMKEFREKRIGFEDKIDSLMTEMIISIYRRYTEKNSAEDKNSGIIEVRRAIQSSPEEDWTLRKMADLSGYSVSRFCELYNELYDISPINDVIAQRIDLAKQLLLSGQATVTHTAEMCGFNTIGYFSKCFKAHTGVSPREFIRGN